MAGVVSYDTICDVAYKALTSGRNGARTGYTTFQWDVAGNCNAPVHRELWARPHPWRLPVLPGLGPEWVQPLVDAGLLVKRRGKYFEYSPGRDTRITIDLVVRCRACERCLKHRAAQWRMRAVSETRQAVRTWLATLTLSPDWQFRTLSEARHADAEGSCRFEQWSADEQFIRHCGAIGPHLTRYVKRIRKETCAPLRYLLVAERHASGMPHFHALLHETDVEKPARKAILKNQWLLGHSHFKLCEKEAAGYVCKYLAKDLAARVRASLRYGRERSERIGAL